MLVLVNVVIGVVFVYLLLALVCTTANEWIAGVRKLRARTLEEGIRGLLGPMADDFFAHPLVNTLSSERRGPSYIPSHVFSSVVLDLLGRRRTDGTATGHTTGAASAAQHVESGIDALKATILPRSADHAAHAAALEAWFDTTMDRVSGWYKRRPQLTTLAGAPIASLLTHADTLHMICVLCPSPTVRGAASDQARTRPR